MYKSPEEIYAPINLNRGDNENVDAWLLQYTDYSNPPQYMETYSRVFQVLPNHDYYVTVTIYARNTTSTPFYFRVNWDGTIAGFSKAFTTLRNIPQEYVS